MSEELLFTETAVFDFLLNIEELKDYDIGLAKTVDGQMLITIGESTYTVESKSELDEMELDVDEQSFEAISDFNEEQYDTIIAEGNVEVEEDVDIESGIIAEAVKTLAIGGLVRLGKAYLTSDKAQEMK